jgi:hypothetical protein
MYEVGVITAHPLVVMYKQCLSIYRTWRHCKKFNFPYNKWYGVYYNGSELRVADVGCLPVSLERATLMAKALNDDAFGRRRV